MHLAYLDLFFEQEDVVCIQSSTFTGPRGQKTAPTQPSSDLVGEDSGQGTYVWPALPTTCWDGAAAFEVLLPGSLGVTLHTSALLYFTEKGERVSCICRETRPRAGFRGSQPWCERTCSEPRCVGHLGWGWWKQTAVLGVQRASLSSQRCFRAGLGAALLPGEQEPGPGPAAAAEPSSQQPLLQSKHRQAPGSGHKAARCTAPPRAQPWGLPRHHLSPGTRTRNPKRDGRGSAGGCQPGAAWPKCRAPVSFNNAVTKTPNVCSCSCPQPFGLCPCERRAAVGVPTTETPEFSSSGWHKSARCLGSLAGGRPGSG